MTDEQRADRQERFAQAVEHWEQLDEQGKQDLIDQTSLEMTLEDLKKMGLVEGNGFIDLEIGGMLFGYAYAKGYRPNQSEQRMRELMKIGPVFGQQ